MSLKYAKILILQMAIGDEYREKFSPFIRHNGMWARRHSYDHIWYDDYTRIKDKHISWCKLDMMASHLPYYDWVVWLDADTLVMDHKRKIEPFLDTEYDYVFSCDYWSLINCGVWAVRNTPKVLKQLEWWQNQPQICPRFWEQAIIEKTLPMEGFELNGQIAGLYNNLNPDLVLMRIAAKHNVSVEQLRSGILKEMSRELAFDIDYHLVCHFAGRTVEQKSVIKLMLEMLTKVRR